MSFHSAFTSTPRSSKWPHRVFPHYLRIKFPSHPFMLHEPHLSEAPHVQFSPLSYHHIIQNLGPVQHLFTSLFIVQNFESPPYPEARRSPIACCPRLLTTVPFAQCAECYTMETVSVCLSVLTFKL